MYAAANENPIGTPLGRSATSGSQQLLPRLVVVSIFLPEALGFFLFDFRFTIARAVFVLALPKLLLSFSELVASSRYRFVPSDLLVPVAMGWIIFAEAQNDGLASAIKSGGITALEFGAPYFAMRSLVRTGRQAQDLVGLFCMAASIAGFLGILDGIFNEHVLREGLARITGYEFFYFDRASSPFIDYRLGFLRAQGPLEQPIIYGVVMCYALMLSRTLGARRKILCRVGCGIGLFLSASSAPWEGLVVGIGLAYYGRFCAFPAKWGLLIMTATLAACLVFLTTVNPLGWIFNHLTLDASTGYYRLMVWDAAGADVLDSPVFGLGTTLEWFRPSWMSSTVDSLWLRSAMLFGIPGSVLIALALIGACSLPARQTRENAGRLTTRDIALSETLDILTFLTIFLGFTVFYWGSAWILMALLAGLRASLGQFAASK